MIQMAQTLLLYFEMKENAKFSLTCFAMKRECTLKVAKELDHLSALTYRQRSAWETKAQLFHKSYMATAIKEKRKNKIDWSS